MGFKKYIPGLNSFNNKLIRFLANGEINPLASPSAGAPALNYGDVNTETTSPGEVKGLIKHIFLSKIYIIN